MDKTDQVRALARKLDALDARRAKLTAEIDAEIAEAQDELRRLIDPSSTRPKAKAPRKRTSAIGDRVVELLTDNPEISHADMAIAVYGDDSPDSRHKVRAQLFNLKRSGRVRREESSGRWEVVPSNGTTGAVMHS